ncbi:DNA polymerase III subunit delta [Helicobacter cetorum]|uniref:DNA polymerase III subunit delta n=1 Tax=Helicobacter cetorum (strain ATCC BAA-540 / CCUG 52418 / MIT 99-5656) TaxID=1163745 RepID=I0EQ82_HELCM|nr:DNA polymerase III subunit delta [Helicobacter cetorum]AFI05101.1 DNA polymerase III subunit delta [Helicobacter cetorum MIT 99-5656]
MYRKDLDNYLKQHLPKAVFLYGEFDFFIHYYIQMISSLIKRSNPNIETSFFYASDYETSQVMTLLEQDSLFGDSSLVVLKLDFALLGRKKFKENDINLFLKALERPSNHRLIVGLYGAKSELIKYKYSSDTMVKMFQKSPLKDQAIYARFFTPKTWESLKFLQEKAHALGVNINSHLLNTLFEINNEDLGIALSDLEKLAILNTPITLEDIQELSSNAGDMDLQKLILGLFLKKSVLNTYDYLLKEGKKDQDILRGLERYFYQLFLFFAHIKTTGLVDAKEVLGYVPPKEIAENYAKNALRLKEVGYKRVFEIFRLWHVQSMQGQKELGFLYLAQIQKIINN